MNIAFVNRMLGMTRGGGEIWDLEIGRALETLGVDVTYYVGKPISSDLTDPIEEFQVVKVPTPHLRDFAYASPRGVGGTLEELDAYAFRRDVVKHLQQRDHDIVHINSDPRFACSYDDIDSLLTVKMNGPPHSFWYDTIHPWKNSYALLSRFDAVVATGITTEKIQAKTNISVATINPGVDTSLFRPAAGKYETVPTVLYVGRFVPVKNLKLLVDAFASLRETMPEVRLILVGDGPVRDDIESHIKQRGVGDAVELTGYIDQTQLSKHYQRADVFALASTFDNHPITILEALSCETPVVAPKVGWIPEMVSDGETGLLYETGDQQALTRQLEVLLTDKKRRVQMGERGRTTVVDKYDWQTQAKKLLAVFESVLDADVTPDTPSA